MASVGNDADKHFVSFVWRQDAMQYPLGFPFGPQSQDCATGWKRYPVARSRGIFRTLINLMIMRND
jgi:hypothetical protein